MTDSAVQIPRIMDQNQVNMTTPKETHKALITNPIEMEISELTKNSE